MKAILILFDSLNRHLLPPYGCDWVHAPNFQRLAENSVTFDNCYIGSMPCIPVRRELHTGRYNFLHRSWSPLEPYDDSVFELLRDHGIYTHLITDHYHYWEDGGATYHPRYSSFEFFRGQEGDNWKGVVRDPENVEYHSQKDLLGRANAVNRLFMRNEKQHSQTMVFDSACEFIETNCHDDNWLLQVETFDPHEPFFTYEDYHRYYHTFEPGCGDWPDYGPNRETQEKADYLRNSYAALLSMCDYSLGRILDKMDKLDLWKDTMLLVHTDHGLLLGEHDTWGKNVVPYYNENARIPLFIWDPRCQKRGERRKSLVQNIDVPVTLCDYFGLPKPKDMQGALLRETVDHDLPVRQAALFGIFGGHVCCTDGEYVYMRGAKTAENAPLNQYTMIPTHMRGMFPLCDLRNAEMSPPFSFTKGCPLMKIPCCSWTLPGLQSYYRSGWVHPEHLCESLLFYLPDDPTQEHPIQDEEAEDRMIVLMRKLMEENDAPPEQFVRLGI